MALPRGIDHFSEFFKDFQDDYVIIGGGAASVYLEDEGLGFRSTKDIDVVLFTNNSTDLNKRIVEYIELGGYEKRERTDNKPLYYRFTSPSEKAYPEILELFSRNENKIDLKTGQYIIPVPSTVENPLSAILLDDDYFNLIKSHATKSEDGYSIIDPAANICLKARAYRELGERGEDKRKQKKHLKDIIRLTQVLKGQPITLTEVPLQDLKAAAEAINAIPAREIKQIGDISISKDDALTALKEVFAI